MARLDFTENQRIIEDGRYLLRPFSIVSLFSQAQLQHIADDIQLGFKYLHRCRLHSLSGQLHPVFDMTVKQCFLLFFCFFQCFFNLCPLTPVSGIHWEKSGFLFFIPFHQGFLHIPRISSESSNTGWASHLMKDASTTSSCLQSFARLTSVTPHLSFTAESSTGHSIPHVAAPVLSWGEWSLAGKALPSTAWRCFCKGALLAHASLVYKDNQVLL